MWQLHVAAEFILCSPVMSWGSQHEGCKVTTSVFFWNSNRQMVSLRRLKFGGTPLHWPKPSDKCDILLKKNPGNNPTTSLKIFVPHQTIPQSLTRLTAILISKILGTLFLNQLHE
jgi:hypothetical protein